MFTCYVGLLSTFDYRHPVCQYTIGHSHNHLSHHQFMGLEPDKILLVQGRTTVRLENIQTPFGFCTLFAIDLTLKWIKVVYINLYKIIHNDKYFWKAEN